MAFRTFVVAAAAACAAAYDNGSPNSRLPPLGWSSWIALGPGGVEPIFDFCDEFTVKKSIDAFVSLGLAQAGYKHIHLDDCWAGPRNATGFITPEPDHFPNGMKTVVDYAHSKGLSFGLYTCAGTETCVGNRPGSKDHWSQDAQVYAEWGVDWVKMDWCNTNGMVPQQAYANMSMALNATGRPMGFNMCEWGVDQPWTWGDAVAQSWRMAGDHTGVWSSTKSVIAASAAIPAANSGQPYGWNDMDMLETGCGLNTTAGMNAGCAHANDREANMTLGEWRTEFSMWAISASPLMFTSPIMTCTPNTPPVSPCTVQLVAQHSVAPCTLGTSYGCWDSNSTMWTDNGCRGEFTCNGQDTVCDVDGDGLHSCPCAGGYDPVSPNVTCTPYLSPVQQEILFNTEVIAINQDVTPQGRPLAGHEADLQVWARQMSDGTVAVAFYNQEDAPATISVSFTALGWSSSTSATARDLWAHADLGSFTGSYPASGGVVVQPHEVHLVRLTKTSV